MTSTFRDWLDSLYGDDSLPGQLAHTAFFCDYWEGDSAESLWESLELRGYDEEALEIIKEAEILYEAHLERREKHEAKIWAALSEAGFVREDESVPYSSSKSSVAADHYYPDPDIKLG